MGIILVLTLAAVVWWLMRTNATTSLHQEE